MEMNLCAKCGLAYEGSLHLCPVNVLYKQAPPLPADVEYLTKQLEIADGNLADCERNLEESIADNDKANERIKALEALAKQMAEALKQILNTKHDKSEWLARRLLAERALDAYKRGINE